MRLDTAVLFAISILIMTVTSNATKNDTNKSVTPNRPKYHIHWTKDLDLKLMDIWERTNPLKKNHSSRMLEFWRKEVKDYENVHGKLLKDRARDILRGKITVPDLPPINSSLKRTKIYWTPDMEVELYRIFKSIKPSSNRPQQMYDEWLKTHEPNENITPIVLYRHALYLQNSGFENGNPNAHLAMQRHHWSAEENLQLMKIWNEVYGRGGKNTSKTIFSKWKELHPDNGDVTPNKVATQINLLLNKGFIIPPEHNEKGVPIRIDKSLKRKRQMSQKSKQRQTPSSKSSKIKKISEGEEDLLPQHKDDRNNIQLDHNEDNSHTLQPDSYENYQSRNDSQLANLNITLNHHLNDNSRLSDSKPSQDHPSPVESSQTPPKQLTLSPVLNTSHPQIQSQPPTNVKSSHEYDSLFDDPIFHESLLDDYDNSNLNSSPIRTTQQWTFPNYDLKNYEKTFHPDSTLKDYSIHPMDSFLASMLENHGHF